MTALGSSVSSFAWCRRHKQRKILYSARNNGPRSLITVSTEWKCFGVLISFTFGCGNSWSIQSAALLPHSWGDEWKGLRVKNCVNIESCFCCSFLLPSRASFFFCFSFMIPLFLLFVCLSYFPLLVLPELFLFPFFLSLIVLCFPSFSYFNLIPWKHWHSLEHITHVTLERCYIGYQKKNWRVGASWGSKKTSIYIYIYIREVIDIPTYLGGVFHMFSSYAE